VAAPVDPIPKVLLVDDRPENLLALEAVLAQLGVEIVSANSGEEALRALLLDDYAVVLLDVQMPGMDGFETARFIRGRERSATTPIIFLTALSQDVDQILRGYEAGAVDYVLKPFEPVVLRSKVAVFADLDRQRRARERADELLKQAWESAPSGVLLIDGDGFVMRANPALLALAGRAALPGRPLDELFHPDDRETMAATHAAIFAGRVGTVTHELRVVDDEGEEIPVSAIVAPVAMQDGEPTFMFVQLDDLRSRREAERAQARLAAERVARREAEASFERERHIASTLQRDLLPRRLPYSPGVSLAAHFHAGGDGTEVGGDWYDVFPLPGGRLGLVVGDVAGRGVAAAARMGQLRSVARAYAVEGHPPEVVAQRLNFYHQTMRADDLTTLIYAVVEPDLGRVRFVNAGHPPPAVVVPGSAPRLLEGGGPALGIAEICTAPELIVDFPPGATLVLYTDGLVERRREGIDLGLGRLVRALAHEGDDIESLRERVLSACLVGAAVDDDVTALFVRAEPVLGPSVRFTLSPDADALGALRRMLRRWLAEMEVPAEDVAGLVMAANEAWQNAIEHGHGFQPVPVSVRFELAGGQVSISVRDAGGRGLPAGDPDRGRGIDLMRALVDEATLDLGSHRGGVVVLRQKVRVPVRP